MLRKHEEESLVLLQNDHQFRQSSYRGRLFHKMNSRSWHDGVIKWKHFPRYWPFVSPVNFPHKWQWRETLILSLICAWINGWVNNHAAGDLRRHRAHYDYDATVMVIGQPKGRLCEEQLPTERSLLGVAWGCRSSEIWASAWPLGALPADLFLNPSDIYREPL